MVERDLRDLLEPFTGDNPSPEVVDQIWRRLDNELSGDVPFVTAVSEEVTIVTLEKQEVGASARRPRWMIGGLAAAAVLVVVGVLSAVLNDGDEPVEGVAAVATGSEGQSTSTIVVPEPEPEPGPVEQLLRIYFEGGIEAAAGSDLAGPDLVYGPGGADDPGDTWFTGLAGYWVDPDLELECVDTLAEQVVCLVEAEIPLTRLIGRRGQLFLAGRVDADGQVVSIEPAGNSERRVLGAYERWLNQNHPEVVEACDDTGGSLVCYFPDDLLDEYAASDDFEPGEPEPLSLP